MTGEPLPPIEPGPEPDTTGAAEPWDADADTEDKSALELLDENDGS